MRSAACLLLILATSAFAQVPDNIEKDQGLCKAGEPNLGACLRVAEFFRLKNDLAAAATWYEPPCLGGDEVSCLRIGDFYKDKHAAKETLKWFRLACLAPSSKGLGCYEVGLVAKDNKSEGSAKHWFEKACSQGYKPACKAK